MASTGMFERVLDSIESRDARDEKTQRRTVTGLMVIILVQAALLAMIVSGLLGVAITGKLPNGATVDIHRTPQTPIPSEVAP